MRSKVETAERPGGIDLRAAPGLEQWAFLPERNRERVLQVAADDLQEARDFCAVGDAVVGGERDVHALAGHDLAVLHDGHVLDGADRQDRRLRR